MELIDTHCHLYLEEFSSDRKEVIKRAEEAGVKKFLLPNIDSSSVDAMLLLAKDDSNCLPMMGLHPCSVNQNWKTEIADTEKWLFEKDTKWYGIGETGLDYYWDQTFISTQKENFQQHIDWAKQLRLPIIIHSRDALDDCIEMIEKNKDENLQGIFHCFSGTMQQAQRIMNLDFYMGIGGVITFKKAGLAELASEIPLQYLVLETDSPYLAPVPFRGKRNESSYLKFIVSKIAEVQKQTEEEIANRTTGNAKKVFRLN
jgi:TatD DNase family protein